MRNRCGAKGTIVRSWFRIGVKITSLVSEVTIGRQIVSLPEDLSVGMFISMKNLYSEHRGLAIVDEKGEYIDEGEIWPLYKGSSVFHFVSDYDNGRFAGTPVKNLVGRKVEIKLELFDELGAYRRLREFKKLCDENKKNKQ